MEQPISCSEKVFALFIASSRTDDYIVDNLMLFIVAIAFG